MTNEVVLDGEQESYGRSIGEARRRNAIKHKVKPGSNLKAPPQKELEIDIRGALGELAVAEWSGLEWDAYCNGTDFKGRPDVGQSIEVKTVNNHFHRLIVAIGSAYPSRIYVLVSAQERPTYRIIGWCRGSDIDPETMTESLQPGRSCYVVPRHKLKHPNDLLELIRSGEVK